MFDYNDPEFIRWMQERYPEELQMNFGNKMGYTLPKATMPVLGLMSQTAFKIPGIMNPLLSTGLYAGGALLKALQGDPGESVRRAAKRRLTGMLGTDVIDVNKYSNIGRAAMMPRLGAMANAYTRRFGLNSGKASQMMLGEYSNTELEMLAELMRRNAELKAQRDLSINSALLNYRG
jgi:hypothetical protein